MTRGRFDLGDRVEPVFERMLGEQRDVVDSRELAEAEAFWDWLGTFERPVETEPAPSNWRPLLARVGAFAAAIAAAWLLMIGAGLHMPWAGSDAASGTRYAAGRGERRVIDMRDGSVITLAAESAIDVRYTSANRLVRLERGEALFKVAHNKQRPFIVEAAGGQVTAVGTAFDVKLASPSKAQVTVVEGVIGIAVRSANPNTQEQITRLARKGEEVSFGVDPEQQARVAFIGTSAKADIGLATAWTRGMLYFHGEPLVDVIRTANRYASDQIALPTGANGQVPVYGIIAEGDTAALRDLIAHPDGRSGQR